MPVWLAPLFGFLQPILDKFLPDKTQQLELQTQLQQLAMEQQGQQFEDAVKIQLAQIGVNNTEAQSENLFKSGWRPAIGWACVAAFTYDFLVRPLLQFVALAINPKAPIPPNLDLTEMMPVLLGMLGLGTLRTVEKVQGVQTNNP